MQITYISHVDGIRQTAKTVADLRLSPFRDDYSLQFNGVDEYIDCGDNCNFSSSDIFSICFWIKGSDKTDEHAVVSRWEGNTTLRGWYVHTQATSGYPIFMMSSGSGNDLEVEFQTDVLDGNWNFVVVTKNTGMGSGTVACSVNDSTATPNVLTNSLSGDTTITHDLYIGGTDATLTPEIFMLGLLDDISIWQVVLSSTAITNLYNLGYPLHVGRYTTPTPDDLLHYWRMETVSGGYIEDESLGNFAAGLLVNMDASNRNVDVPDGVPGPSLLTNLYNYFHFDEGAWIGTDPVTDSSGNGRNGVCIDATGVNSPIVAFGTNSADLASGGTSELDIAAANASQQSLNWSMELWIRFTDLSASGTLFNRRDTGELFYIRYDVSSGNLELWAYDGFLTGHFTIQAVTTGVNYHMVIQHNGTNFYVYMNNSLQLTLPIYHAISGPAYIRFLNDAGSIGLRMDEFAWWNRLLDPSEISTLYNSGNGYQIL